MYTCRPIPAYTVRTKYRAYLFIHTPIQAYKIRTTNRAYLYTHKSLYKPIRHL